MAGCMKTTIKKTSPKEISDLTIAFRKLNPTKHHYSQLTKSDLTRTMSSGSSFVSNPHVTILPVYGPAPCPSSSRNSCNQQDKFLRKKDKEAQKKELLQQLHKSVNDAAITLNMYMTVCNSKK